MGEKTILQLINHELSALGINYYYMVNDSKTVTYPYVTGEYTEYEYRYEDSASAGEILLEAWTRGTESELLEIKDKIKDKFKNYQTAISDSGMAFGLSISYLNKMPRRTDTEGLKKLEIRLQINYWESE